MSNKSPFEIRLDLLNLAQSILQDRTWAKRQALEQVWNTNREIAFHNADATQQTTQVPNYPDLPTISTEEIITEAKKLNEFVSNG